MIDDMFNIVCDPIFNNYQTNHLAEAIKNTPDNNNQIKKNLKLSYTSKYKLPGKVFDDSNKQSHAGYADDENLFE